MTKAKPAHGPDMDPRMIGIALAVRRACQDRFPQRKKLSNLCTLSACAIVRLCRRMRIDAQVVGGFFMPVSPLLKPQFGNPEHIKAARERLKIFPHAWVRHRRNYIDVTLTQFIPESAPVSILELNDPRFKGRAEAIKSAEQVLEHCGYSLKDLRVVTSRAAEYLEHAIPAFSAVCAPEESPDRPLGLETPPPAYHPQEPGAEAALATGQARSATNPSKEGAPCLNAR